MTKQKMSGARAKSHLDENIAYQLRDAKGRIKKLWKSNALGTALLKYFRSIRPNAIAVERNENGEVVSSRAKRGLLNRLAVNGLRIPFITGTWVGKLHVANLITNAGKAGVASRINGAGAEAAFDYIAIGTGTTAAAAGDTTLETEITTNGGARAQATASRVTTDVANDTARNVLTYNFTGSFAVTEAGVLNAGAAGTLLNRQVFAAVNVESGDSLQVTVDVDVD